MSKKMFANFVKSIFRDITTFGGLPFHGILILFFLATNVTIAIDLVIALVIIVLIAVISRSLYYKPRPKELPHDTWLERLEASSFPSIHAARSMFLATYFAILLQSAATSILLAALALGVCYSRIHMKRHDFWDLLAGSIVGIATAIIVLNVL